MDKSTVARPGPPLRLVQPGSRTQPCFGAALAAFTAIAVASAPGQLAAQTDDAAGTRPNIVVVVSDDIGWGQPGFNGGTEVGTPSLDRIAYEGVKLTQFYVAPSCFPTRASLMSGRYPWKTGNIDERRSDDNTVGMLLDERTIAEALRDTGYSTWMVGKWHLGMWHQAHLPLQRGFDHHFGHYSGFINYYRHRHGSILDWHRNGRPVVEEGYSTFLMAGEAIQLIERHDGRNPFFLYLAFNAAHGPNGVPDEYLEPYAHVQGDGQRAQRGQLKALDDALGWVIDALERKGVLDDTLVVFFNDNGGPSRSGGNQPHKGGKAEYLEGGIRVPAAMRWPGHIPQGSETDALLHVVDLFPTFASLAGASTTDGLPLDGLNAWQTIAAGAPSPRDEVVHSPKVIRSGDWKLIKKDGQSYGSRWASILQLYNIGADPYEETNLASSEAAKVAELRERLDYHRQFARDAATSGAIPSSAAVYGEVENAAYAAEVRTALSQLDAGTPGPVLLRLESSGTSAKLVFNETLDSDSVPPASAFRAVVLPGYRAVDVTEVGVYGSDVLLTLSQAVGIGETVGLTYEVPDTGAVRDADSLAADGVTWVTAEPDGSLGQGPLTATFEAGPSSHDGLSPSTLRLRFSEAVSTSDIALRDLAIGATGGQVSEARRVAGLSWLWDLTLLPSGPAEITVTLPATASCSDTGAVCTTAGKALSNSPQLTIPFVPPVVSIAAVSSPVTEGTQAVFVVTVDRAAARSLTLPVRVSETGSMLAGTPPASVTVPPGATSATLSVVTAGDSVVEADSTVTASLVAGAGYVLGAATSASITVEDVPALADTSPRPNIVVFLADDMGWAQPGFNGGTAVTTPNMDRIAHEGVKLTQFYVQPVCSPTRASLLTGRYAWKNGMEVRPSTRASQGMLTDERTIAETLRSAGYATWIVGKWHLGQWRQAHLPLQRGFDHHYGLYSAKIDSFTHLRSGVLDWHRNGRPVVESGYSTFLLAEEAIQLMERHDGESPFFLYLPFNAVHEPFDAPREFVDLFPGEGTGPRSLRMQRAMLKAMDVAIGRVLDALEGKGALDDTLVMFLNDNGGSRVVDKHDLNKPYRDNKSSFLEGGIRVPAVMRWPAEIPAGSESDALLHVADLFPTFARLAGADPHAGLPLDGLDAWAAIARGGESPRTEVVHSLGVIRVGDWKLIEENERRFDGSATNPRELYNIAEDPYETTNLAATNSAKVAELQARLAYHAQFARAGEAVANIRNFPPAVYGAAEDRAYGAEVATALAALEAGNPGPTLVQLEADGNEVTLVYDETLTTSSVPPADAFSVVVKPGYRRVAVTAVEVSGTNVLLTLAQAAVGGETVGLTYEVPDTGAIRDADGLAAVGVTWTTATATGRVVSSDMTLSALGLSGIDIGTFASAVTAYTASVSHSVATTTVTATANHPMADVSIVPGPEVSLAEGANEIRVTVTAEDGTTTQAYTVTVTRASVPDVSVEAVASPVREGTAAEFEVGLAEAAFEALTVSVDVTESGSMLAGAPPVSVAFAPGDTRATLSVPTAGDSVVEADSTVTASVAPGTGYTVGTKASAAVTVEDDDVAAFTVTATPATVKEGESATLTVEVTSGVTFAVDQTVDLEISGTASASDHAGVPAALTLAAGTSSATAKLAAKHDGDEEPDETLTVTASLGGDPIGSATVTIESVSHDATLSRLSLSGIDIGTFASGTTAYSASVPNATTSTAVTAAANHPEADVSISPGAEVNLAEGANEITVTVTAEDGTTEKTYAVTVTRTTLPEVSVAAVQERVSEAELARFTVSRTGPTTEPLDVRVLSASTTSEEIQTLTVRIGSGERSVTRRVQVGDNTIVEDDVTLTWTLAEGEDYSVSADHTSASVVLEENDIPEFAVSVEPAEIAEGESATVTVAITNGVTFRQPQTIALSVSGTASASDFTGLPATLTLRAFGSSPSFSATATLTAAVDQQDEEAETVMVTASHNGPAIGSATVTINSVSRDATLAALSLSGIDIGTFSAETTAYAASVANSVETTTVTATASHSEASVMIAPGPEVSLAEGENTVTVTVTAEDGTTRTYSVTVTRASLLVASVAAVASRVSEGERAEFRISLTDPAAESLRVGIRWERSDQSQSVTQHTVFRAGLSSKISSFSKSDDKVVREDLTVTITLEDGAGYRVSEDGRSAQVVLEENDAAEFAVSVDPASVAEGETAKLEVRTTNGVTFAADQTIALGFAGSTATKGADYSVSAESLTLRAGRRRVTAALTAIADSDQEDDETVRIEAAHGGAVIGTATLTITGSEPAPEAAGEGFSLVPANASPSGIWSDGETAWVADLADARLYAYRREDGERQAERDISTEASPMGLWSDGQTLWVAHLGGGLRAHRLSDGARLPGRDLALEGTAAPGGVWSDGETAWVSEWLGDTVHAYGLSSGRREAGRDIRLAGGNLMPAGLWSDGQTLWVADWRERVYAYRLSNGGREPGQDVIAGLGDTDPTGLWSADGALLSTGWEGGEVRAYRLAEAAAETPAKQPGSGPTARAASLPTIADPALRTAIAAALGKGPGETVSPDELAGLEVLAARSSGIRDLSGLERAVSLKALDLGFNPLADLRPLAALPALESLNLDGAATDLQALASLPRLQRLSLWHNGLEDLWPLARLTSLTELSLGANRIADLRPLAGLGSLVVLRLDRNRVADLWPLASLAGLEALELEANRVQDLRPLAGLARLRSLALGGNGLTELHALSGLKELADLGLAGNAVEDLGALSDLAGLRRLDLRGTAVGDLQPLRGLPSLVWVHVGGSGIADLTPLDGLDGLTAAGRDDLESPSRGRGRFQRSRGLELDLGGQ